MGAETARKGADKLPQATGADGQLAAKNGPWQERWRVGRGSCDIVLQAVEDLLKTGPVGFYGQELWPLRDNPAAVRAVWMRAAEASGWRLPTAGAIRRARQNTSGRSAARWTRTRRDRRAARTALLGSSSSLPRRHGWRLRSQPEGTPDRLRKEIPQRCGPGVGSKIPQ